MTYWRNHNYGRCNILDLSVPLWLALSSVWAVAGTITEERTCMTLLVMTQKHSNHRSSLVLLEFNLEVTVLKIVCKLWRKGFPLFLLILNQAALWTGWNHLIKTTEILCICIFLTHSVLRSGALSIKRVSLLCSPWSKQQTSLAADLYKYSKQGWPGYRIPSGVWISIWMQTLL